MTRWAMVADLDRCVGCQTCTAACRHANATAPAVQWRRVLDIETGSYPNVARTFVPVGCQHCADPPCLKVCPTGATAKRADGIVTIDYDLCIGCAYCDVACPYQARFKLDGPRFAYGAPAMRNETERADPGRLGVAQKCTFCADRIDFGRAHGLTPGVDPRATPACVNACIAGALHFGDLDDKASNVARLLREQEPLRMHDELGTGPGFFYVNGRDRTPVHNGSTVTGGLRQSGIAPAHQQHWDWKASGNFICGGAGAGLFLLAAVADQGGGSFRVSASLALALVALGLLLLLFKIGRPLRSLYVLRRPDRSWMAREAWVAGAFFPLGLLAVGTEEPALVLSAAVAAGLFLLSQAMILKDAKGIPAWRTSLIVPLIAATGLAEGAGLLLAVMAGLAAPLTAAGAVAGLAVMGAALRAAIWAFYLRALRRDRAPSRTLDILSGFGPWLWLAGLALPLALVGGGLMATEAALPLFALAGACILGTGSALKLVLVTRAAFNQGFALPQGSASVAKPAAQASKPETSLPASQGDRAMSIATASRSSRVFMFDADAETMPRQALTALQTERLKQTLKRAYANVPHYRRKFDSAGVKPGDLRGLADLARFPFTVKTDLRDTYPFGMFAVPREKLLRLHASSGTTGRATVVGYTEGDLQRWAGLMARSLACAGANPGDIVHNAYGYGLFTGGLGAHYGAERLGCTVVPVSGGGTERQVSLLSDFGAHVLCATPSYALNLAEVAAGMGIDLRQSSLRLGLFGAEPWSDAMRRDLEARLGITAIDVYGLSEIMGPGVACECHVAQSGLHGWEDHFLFEVIDPDTSQPLPYGETGELVITTLTKEALPMIRYRTRDITRLSDEPCACGRTHVRIMRVAGRNDDMLIIRGVNVYPSQVEAVLVGLPGLAPHYQIVLTRDGALDAITVEVEPDAPMSEAERAAKAREITHHIKSMIGVTCSVAVKSPGDIPRSQGKAVRVRDLRQRPN
jgi:phenylacetate-CoA ligase